MRKNRNLAWMSAIALTSAMSFTACSSDDDTMQNVNPSYDGNSVKTQFAINVPKAAKTRQTAEITQNGGVFRGMEEIRLVPLTTAATDATTAAQDIIQLANYDGFDGNSENYKLYNDIEIKVGVTNFLFYGQAKGTKGATTTEEKQANGVLNKTITTNTADTKIELQPISDATLTNATLLGYLNRIMAAHAGWTADPEGGATTHLGILYKSFTSLTAGSANSILKTVEKLYNGVALQAYADNAIAAAIKAQIEVDFTATPKEEDGLRTYTLAYTNATTFPINLGLPEGAARLTYNDDTRKFNYVPTALGGTNQIAVDKICYPAALNYFASTALKATNSEMTAWPSNAKAWEENAWTGWENKVLPTTRTIALTKNINYGVALLETTVKTAATLSDNSQDKGGALEDLQFTMDASIDKLKLTGVLVGGQPTLAKWDFTPASASQSVNTIWDCKINGDIYANTTKSATNYTMVLDNTNTTEAEKVNIAIELENNLGDFYGVDGLIPTGSKFYLIAQLDPSASTGVTQPDGTIISHVFQKDYTTTANLTITSLKNAYVTIPDLRSTKLQLGLSVDLTWQAGLTFNVEIQ